MVIIVKSLSVKIHAYVFMREICLKILFTTPAKKNWRRNGTRKAGN